MTFKKMDDTMEGSPSKSKASEKSDVTVSKMKKNNLDLANAQYTSKPKDDQKSAEQIKLDEKSAEQKKLDEMCEKYIENVDDKFVCKFGDENVFTSLQGARCHMKTHIKVKTDDPALQAIKPSEIFEPVPNPITVTTPEGEFKFETVNDVLRALDSNPVPPIPGNFH